LLRRLGRAVLDAVRDGRRDDHGPLPKLPPSGRRRMDRHADRRLIALKRWRAERAQQLALDPGVLCPNSALEAIAWRAPNTASDLEGLPELKGWFVREFGAEVVTIALEAPPMNPQR
jgi:ribonuclease D